jgi:hypothetical protein
LFLGVRAKLLLLIGELLGLVGLASGLSFFHSHDTLLFLRLVLIFSE